MISYLIYVTLCWLLFYAIYLLILSKETFFSINRWYLLSSLVLGLLIPLFYIDFSSFFYEKPAPAITFLADSMSEMELVIQNKVAESKSTRAIWIQVILGFYWLGVLVFFMRFLHGLNQIFQLYRSGKIYKKGNYQFILTNRLHLPFSFFNYLFWSEKLELEATDSGKIINHEIAHINQWHSLDVLFVEILSIFLWFSPPIYWYKKSLRVVHEYLADAYVLRDMGKKQYGHLLLKQAQSGLQIALANHFIHSQLKKRIHMMTKDKSRRKALMRYLSALPLLLLLVLVFSNKNVKTNFQETTAKASIGLMDFWDGDFDPKKAKRQLQKAYEESVYPYIHTDGSPITEAMRNDQRITDLNKECKKLIAQYPENEAAIQRLAIEVAAENGYALSFRGADIIFRAIEKPKSGKDVADKLEGLVDVEVIKEMTRANAQYQIYVNGEPYQGDLASIVDDIATVDVSKEEGIIKIKLKTQPSEVFKVVEEMPYFPGGCEDMQGSHKEKIACGNKEMLMFIYKNILYPKAAREAGIEGTVIVQFIVNTKGELINPKIVRSIGGGIDEEVLRIIDKMPLWVPGRQRGKAVNVQFNLPVKFRLEGDEEKVEESEQLKKEFGDVPTVTGLAARKDVFKVVEEMPRFPGCEDMEGTSSEKKQCADQKMLEFIYQNIKYPEAARKNGIEGIAVVQFVINKLGEIINPKIVRSIGGGTDEEILKVVDKMPLWTPGKQKGKVVNVQFNLPVKFKLAEDAKPKLDEAVSEDFDHSRNLEILERTDVLVFLDGEKFDGTVQDIYKIATEFKTVTIMQPKAAIEQYGDEGKNGAVLFERYESSTETAPVLSTEGIQIKAFPNPAKGQLNVQFEGKASPTILTIFDLNGKEVYREKLDQFDGIYQKNISLYGLSKGTLIVNVHQEGKDVQRKVIIQ